jgi:hypothetical protein
MQVKTAQDKQIELLDLLFEKLYNCTATPIMLDAAAPAPVATKPALTNVSTLDGVVHTQSTENEHLVIEAMFGHTRYNGNESSNREIGSKPIDVRIPIAHMAEMVSIGGTFILNNPRVAPEIVDTIESYENIVYERKIYEPHFRQPPEEDMDKLRGLKHAILPLSCRVMSVGEGVGGWADLDALFTRTGVYTVGKDTEDFFAIKKEPIQSTKPDYSQYKRDPYKF